MKVSGRCYCGQISFEAEIQPDKVRVCHCTDCQTLSGSAFRIPREGFSTLKGRLRGRRCRAGRIGEALGRATERASAFAV
jgi:hypothetical protein